MCLGLARIGNHGNGEGGHGNGEHGHGNGKAGNGNGDGDHGQPNYMYKAFIGLAAVAGFLALATIAFIGNKVLSKGKSTIPRQVWI